MKAHPYAELFPMMPEDELRELAADIKVNGQREDITTLDGMILDGRNRYRACEIAGVEPMTRGYLGDNPLAFVLSSNLHRRHLDASQRAMVATRLANLSPGANQHENKAKEVSGIPLTTQSGAAEALGVSVDSVKQARTVVQQGAPELVAAVDAGAVSVNAAAEVAKLPKSEQKKVVAKGPEAVKKAAKASRQAKAKDKPEPVNQPAAAESASDTPVHTPPDRLTMLCPTCCGTGRVPKKQPVQPLYTAAGMPEIPAALDTPDFILAWESWLHERKRRKQTVTPNAARLQLRDLDAHGVKVAIETIETSIKNGWTGLFPGKAGTNGQHAHGRNGRVQAGVRVVGAPGDFDDCAPALS